MPRGSGHSPAFRLAALLVVFALCCLLPVLSAGCGSQTAAATRQGMVEGKQSGGLVVFKGIPYAAPPVGRLRWKPPAPHAPWKETLKAYDFGAAEAQPKDDLTGSSGLAQSEDCLTLNVWTPGLDGAKRPVMVWIHGGGFANGSSAEPTYDGSRLSSRGDAVIVTINYRLGAFGFLYLGEVGGAGYEQSGNLGLLDQAAALRWVRANIASFGGDPGNVTVFGESAGAMSACTLMAMPAAKGLFRRVIAESGALNLARSTLTAASVTGEFMKAAGVTDVAGLSALSTGEIVRAESDLVRQKTDSALLFGPVIDGSAVPEPPLFSIEKGSASGVDLLIGTNLDEMRLWTLANPAIGQFPLGVVAQFFPPLAKTLGGRADAVAASYKSRRPAASEGDVTMAVLTDFMFRLPAIRVAEAHTAGTAKTYMYLFTWASARNPGLGSCHAMELPFVFGTIDTERVRRLIGPDAPRGLSDTMQDAWLAFAGSGDPNGGKVPEWKPYDMTTRATMVFNVRSEQQDDPYSADRRLWDGVAFDSVIPSL